MNAIPDPEEDFEGCVKGLADQAMAELAAIPEEVYDETLVLRAAEHLLKVKRSGIPYLMERARRILLRRVQALPVYLADYEEPDLSDDASDSATEGQ